MWILFLAVGFCVLFIGAGLFVAWNSGMTIGLMGNAEQATITSVRFVKDTPVGDTVKVTVRNAGPTSAAIKVT